MFTTFFLFSRIAIRIVKQSINIHRWLEKRKLDFLKTLLFILVCGLPVWTCSSQTGNDSPILIKMVFFGGELQPLSNLKNIPVMFPCINNDYYPYQELSSFYESNRAEQDSNGSISSYGYILECLGINLALMRYNQPG